MSKINTLHLKTELYNYEFNLLPLKEKAQFTWEHGTYLANRQEDDFRINLYHLDKFFVEVWYDPEEIRICKLRSFKSKKCLDPYLDRIDLAI